MTSQDQTRKADHVNSALAQQAELQRQLGQAATPFDDLRFIHHSFSQVDFASIDTQTSWAGHLHSDPFYINGMTGGSDFTAKYNDLLSQVARETGLSMASGSNSIALKEPDVAASFTIIRQNHPQGFILANLGAHHDLANARRVVELLQADALQIHLNTPQEVVMPEGDRDFSMWLENIADIVANLEVPVIVKEVGFGMSRETLALLQSAGVQTVDISGRGGTNFVRIENARRNQLDFSMLAGWGQSTPEALLEALAYQDSLEILASGGVRHFYDMVKALALGARATGLSGRMLQAVDQGGVQGGIDLVTEWRAGLRHLMLLLNCQDLAALGQSQLLISGGLREYAEARRIDWQALANR